MNGIAEDTHVDALRSFYQFDDAAKRLFDWFSIREKDSYEMPVRVAAKNAGCDYASIVRVFKELDRLGLGSFVVGRKGSESRMKWHYSIRSIASVASGEDERVEETIDAGSGGALEDDEPATIIHEFQLRLDTKVELELPTNFTSAEAERLSGFIRSLPFS